MAPEVALPARHFGRILGTAFILALLALAAWESLWRARGFQPTLEDSAELWSSERLRANRLGKSALVSIGSSRFQLGLDPRVLKAELPAYSPVQLAIDGSASLPVLRNLADDPTFHGSVLVEILPSSFFPDGGEVPTARQREWFHYAEAPPLVSPVELELRVQLRSHFVFPISLLNPQAILRNLWIGDGTLPDPPYWSLRTDRFRPANYALIDQEVAKEHWRKRFEQAHPVPETALGPLLNHLREWAAAIQNRGGQVVFVRMIASSPVIEIEDRLYPRDRYFQKLSAASLKAIEFRDLPGIATLTCPDGSHLDAVGAAKFSALLAKELLRTGLLRAAP